MMREEMNPPAARPWDARLANWLVRPLIDSRVTPNHLTSLRLVVGLVAALAFTPGTFGWTNLAALLLVLSNFLDHTDGELARLSGKASRLGHLYDLASDAVVTLSVFVAIGIGVGAKSTTHFIVPPVLLGAATGCAVSIIFYLRMRIEDLHGKSATQQASLGGFETEDVLYLVPVATLFDVLLPLLWTAAVVAPLFAVWVAFDYRRVMRRDRAISQGIAG